jgi:sulfate-transporting ATPase
VVAAIPIGLVFALPALRTRGVNLAVVTLGLGLTVDRVLFQNVNYTGGIQGTDVGAAKLFGLPIDAISYPGRYATFVLVAFALAACGVANLRRSAAGRRMIAIRSNERAAASLGVSVTRTKLYAFAVSSAIAALGGILIGFRSSSVVYTNFDAMQSIHASAFAVIGGLGYVIGPVLGSTLEGGGIGSLFNEIVPGIDRWMALIGGVSVIGLLLINPDGLVSGHLAQGRWIGLRLRALVPGPLRERQAARRAARAGRAGERAGSAVAEARADAQPQRVVPRRLEVSDLTVRFGGVVAVDALSLSVGPGEIVGLIGPNGAGKTSFIDATSGFVRPAEGRVVMDGVDVVGRSAHARVKAGLARSWQSLELFEDVTVLENLQVASDDSGWREEVLAPLRPGRPVLNPAAAAAVAEFRLEDDLLKRPADIPFGRRRLVGIARAVALNPSVLLLDEPAAGLSDAESAELASLMRRLADRWGMGILLVEHNVDLVMGVCDRVVVMDFGRKIAEGTPAQTRNDPAVVAAYLGGGSSNPEPVEAR